ncbi:SET family sugar efflux transporter-like MFS transporter [Crossiella equi]|uniref:SET family sugar efflux transporter-like MFS transporter n=1 Tax=Crossiella equi TaxID=130796 RepID=A0ABS5APU9_9PSEU|nr:sugar efflux transporter [Crossiella equi]MBP2478598.1 SET family sugar efflux transporter-like MFS transporter [Crossiella equi]
MTVTSEAGASLSFRALLPLASVCISVGLSAAITMPFIGLFLTTQIGVGPLGLGTFLLVAPLAGLVVSAALGRVSDRRPVRRNLMVGGAAAGAAGSVVFAFVRDYWVLLAVAVSLLAVSSCVLAQMFAYARQWAEKSGSARAPVVVSGLRTVISLAWVGGPPLAAVLVAQVGYHGLYLASAAFFVLVVVFALRLPELGLPTPRAADAGGAARRVDLVFAVLAFGSLQAAISLSVKAIPLFVTTDLGGTETDVGLIMGLCAALEIPLMLGFGVLAVKRDQRRLVLFGALVAVLYQGVVALTVATWQVALAQALQAIVISAVMGVGISYFQALAPDRPGFATTLHSNTLTAGGMVSGPLLGIAQGLGFRSAFLMCLVLTVCGTVLLVAAGMTGRRGSVVPGEAPMESGART